MQSNTPLIRRVRSFVRREGRLTEGQRRALQNLWPQYGLNLQNKPYDFGHCFNRAAPLCLEIGFGNGDSVLHNAQKHPEKNYIAIDVYRPGVGTLLLGLEKEELSNVRVFCDDAVEILNQSISDNNLAEVHIYFPDPWHKKRHHKRRLIQKAFIELIAKKLQPQGMLYIATDWQDYAKHIHAVLTETNPLFKLLPSSAAHRATTKFEKRGLRLGHGISDFICQKQTL